MKAPFLAIYTDYDKPCVQLVVYVEPENGVFCYVSYRYENIRPKWEDFSDITRFTGLDTFGVTPHLDENKLTCHPLRMSRAKYSDGNPRNWQGFKQETCTVRPHLILLIQELLTHGRSTNTPH